MKPDTTWKEEFYRKFTITGWNNLTPVQILSRENLPESVIAFIESLLSSSQALVRREGIEEAMRVVESQMFDETKEDFYPPDDGRVNDSLRAILRALQEKLDTKGE